MLLCTHYLRKILSMKPSSSPALGRLSYFGFCLSLLFTLGSSLNSFAVTPPTATAQISDTSLGGGVFDYTITLNNTGTIGASPIGTFWFGWVPGEDFMSVSPTSIVSPSWTANITHGSSTDGYAIQWIASSSAVDVAPGSSLDFSFDSTMTPAAMAGDSTFYPTTPVGTSFVYSGAPFSDAGDQFVVQSVPEPSVSALMMGGLGLLACWRLRRRCA
jgi:hypothetical protein